ncbi:MAG: hypothetical protein ACREVB_17355, partial [Burkholderiales bacterium]
MPLRKHFGTDGVRGTVGQSPMTPDFVLRLGYAAGKVLAKKGSPSAHSAVCIGKDTRISGYMLESALEAGLSAAGVDVLLVGPMPTPAVAYLTRALEEPPPAKRRGEILLELGISGTNTYAPLALDHLAEAYELLDDPHRRATAAFLLARTLIFAGSPEGAAALAPRALAELPQD